MNHRKKMIVTALVIISIFIFGCGQSDHNQNSMINTISSNLGEQTTPTFAPTNTPIPGWNKYSVDRFSIYFPDSFVGGNLNDDLDVILDRIENLGPGYSQIVDMIEESPNSYRLFAIDSTIGSSGNFTNVNIGIEEISSILSVDMLIDATVEQFASDYEVKNKQLFEINGYDAGSIDLKINVSGVDISEILCFVKDSHTVWIIACSTGTSEMDERLPQFEQIINSIEIQPE